MQYYIFTGGEHNPLYDILFQDLVGKDNVTLISALPDIPANRRKVWKYHHSAKLNQKHLLPFRSIWNRYANMKQWVVSPSADSCLVFSNVAMEYYEPSLLRQFQKKYGVKLVLYLLDTYDSYYSKGARQALNSIEFDAVYTYHELDAVNYGFHYFDCYYSKLDITKKLKESDAFFWGSEKGRGTKALTIFQILKNSGYQPSFGLCYVEEADYEPYGIQCNKELTYQEIVNKLAATHCIVDITGENSKGISLRIYEACVYHKKLVTDNPLVLKFRGIQKKAVYLIRDWNNIQSEELIAWMKMDLNDGAEDENPYSPIYFIQQMDCDMKAQKSI